MTQIYEDYLEVILDKFNDSIGGDDHIIRDMVLAQAEDKDFSKKLSQNFNKAMNETLGKLRSEKVG